MTKRIVNYCGRHGHLTVQLLELTPNRARVQFPDGSIRRWSCNELLEHNPEQALDLLRLMAQNSPDQFGPGCNNPYHEELSYLEILAAPSFSDCTQYLSDFPAGPHRLEVVQLLTSPNVFKARSCQEVADLILGNQVRDVRQDLIAGLEPRVWQRVRPGGPERREWLLVYQEFFGRGQHWAQFRAMNTRLHCHSHHENWLHFTDSICNNCGWRICRAGWCCGCTFERLTF